MTKSISRNPLRGFWDAVAAGGRPSSDDLAREGFPKERWSEIRRHVREVHAFRDAGEFASARRLAHDMATDWLRRLGDEWEPPGRVDRPYTDDPRELAERVLRR